MAPKTPDSPTSGAAVAVASRIDSIDIEPDGSARITTARVHLDSQQTPARALPTTTTARDQVTAPLVFSARVRRGTLLYSIGVTTIAVVASTQVHGETSYLTAWLLVAGFFTIPAFFVALAAARRGPTETAPLWKLFAAGEAVAMAIGVLMLGRMFILNDPPAIVMAVTYLLVLTSMLLMGSLIAGAVRLASGLRTVTIDLIDVAAATMLLLAPFVLMAWPALFASSALWFGFPALVLAVLTVVFMGGAAILFARLPAGWRTFAGRFLATLVAAGANSMFSVAQASTQWALPSPVGIALQAATHGILLLVAVNAVDAVAPGIDRLSPAAQVRKQSVTPVIFAVAAPLLIFVAARMQANWALVAAGLILCVVLVAVTLAQRLMVSETVRLYAEVERLGEEQSQQARTDDLTGLPNRRLLFESLPAECSRSRRSGTPLSVVMIDVDHFKRFNDRFGHLRGDDLLRSLADHLRVGLRIEDIAARYGGEEFCLVFPNTAICDAAALIERLRHQPDLRDPDGGIVTFSAGAAEWREGEPVDHLLSRADAALYAAKDNGRNCLVLA